MTGKILEFPRMVTLTVAFSPFEDGEELLENCQCYLDFHGARLVEFGAWGDDDEVGPWFCTFKCFERDAEMLLENLECLSPAPVEISFGDKTSAWGLRTTTIFVHGKP
jgi:hypothetical protein